MARLKGSKELEKRLLQIPHEVLADLQPALIKGAEEIAGGMRALAPVDEGDLVASIEVTGPGGKTPAYAAGGGSVTLKDNQAAVTVGNPDQRHSHLVEFGTVKMAAQPFMRPAFRLVKARVQRRIATAIGKAIKRMGGK